MTIITSRQNPKVRQARALRQRKQRSKQGLFLVEGIRHIGEAADAGALLEYVLYAPDLLTSDYAHTLIAQLQERNVSCHAVANEVFATLTNKDNPQGILAVAVQQTTSLEQLDPHNFPWGVALVSPQDPGNIGTILRTIDAAGASGLVLLDSAADPYHPTAVRASMGALFWHSLVRTSFGEFATWARQHKYHIYGSSARGGTNYRAIESYQFPTILLLGNERHGLTLEQAALCEQMICLPMRGKATSLNLAVAAGVLLYAISDTKAI